MTEPQSDPEAIRREDYPPALEVSDLVKSYQLGKEEI
jgi:hypothetical protein